MIKRFDLKIAEIFEKSADLVSLKWNLARKKLFFELVFSVDVTQVCFYPKEILPVCFSLSSSSSLKAA